MTPSPRLTALRPHGVDFDRFLYAEVGEDRQGGLLSVVSALARVGVDPWGEAALLARMPVDNAVRSLCVLLAKLPAGSGQPADSVALATRLVALLPGRPRQLVSPEGVGRAIRHVSIGGGWPLALVHAIGLMALLAALLLLVQG
jgi:hypothetical protein